MAADGAETLDTHGASDAGLADALSVWSRQPSLAAALTDAGSAYWVLDAAATRILHASHSARPLADAVVGPGGTFRSGLLPGQIRSIRLGATPRLARLRMDPRRIATPTLCLLAGGDVDGEGALLLIVAGPLPALRSAAAEADRVAFPASTTAERPRRPSAGDRFVWRSDAEAVVTEISGTVASALIPVLVGRSWAAAARAGLLSEADAFLAALDGRRTFRGANAVLRLDEAATSLSIELAAAPVGRGGEGFSGYGGYGVIRSIEAIEPVPVEHEPSIAEAGPEMAGADTAGDRSGPAIQEAGWNRSASLPDARLAAWPPMLPSSPRRDPSAPDEPAGTSLEPMPVAAATAVPPARTPNDALPASPAGTLAHPDSPFPRSSDPVADGESVDDALSVTEHAAFREIARALGARYAGDDEAAPKPDGADAHRPEGGAVMPFPGTRSADALVTAALPSAGADVTAFLENLPAAVLIHRDDRVLAVNGRLLDLTGYADFAALEAAGIGRLFRGASPDRHVAAAGSVPSHLPVLIETAAGESRPVAVESGRIGWDGAPAECLILRAVPDVDPVGERAAEELAQRFRDGRTADARLTLDALDHGIVTLDPAARIVAMNRSAAALLACDPREVVGTPLSGLFDAGCADAVRDCLDDGTGIVADAGGRRLGLRIVGDGTTRVAVLSEPSGTPAVPAAHREDRAAFLGHLDRALRTPVAGLVGLAETMLGEPFGAMDGRDRERLREIQASGEDALGLLTDLLDLAIIEAGGLTLSLRPLPLNDLVSACVSTLQAQAAQGRIVLRTSYAPDLAALEADEPSLRQAALNVIANAIKFTAAGGQVIVSTTPSERGGVALKVRDTGPGMSTEEIEEALAPLGGRIGSSRRGGAGRGLPLTRALVEANRGRLRISSRKEEGTLVEILLPGLQTGGA